MKTRFKKTSLAVMVTSMFSPALPLAAGTIVTTASIGAGLLMSGTSAHAQEVKAEASASSSLPSQAMAQSVITLSTNKEVRDPSMFNLPGTNQIVVDLKGVDRNFQAPPAVVNDPLIERFKVKSLGDKVRLVIETKKPVKFGFVKEEGKVLLTLEEASSFVNTTQKLPDTLAGAKSERLASASNASTSSNSNASSNAGSKSSSLSDSERAAIIEKVKRLNGDVKPGSAVVAEKVAPTAGANTVVNAAANAVEQKKEAKEFLSPGAVFTEIKRINLKRESGKNARLSVELSDKAITPKITKQGSSLIVDFPNVAIPTELQRRVGTEALGTVNQTMDVSMQKSNGRIILEQKDNWDYSFYQVENQFVVDVKMVEVKEEEKKYIGKALSMNFQDMEVRAILQVIADFTGLNIMTSDQVTGTMTLRLKDVPWDQALDLVLEARGLQKVKEGNVIWVATGEEVKKNNDAKQELRNQVEKLAPLKLEFFQINYHKAEDLKGVLEGKSENSAGGKPGVKLLSERGTVGVDVRNNMIFVQDIEEKLQDIRKIIKKLDISTKQVLVEAKIVIADSDFGRELGSRFGVRARHTAGSRAIGIGGNITESGNVAGASSAGGATVTPLTNFAAGNGAGIIGLTLLNTVSGNALGIELSALEQNNRGKVLSNPRLLTNDNKKALIEQGSEIPYVTPGSANSPATVTFKKAVLSLGVTPQIAPNGKIIMELNIRKDSIGELVNIQGGGQIPAIDTKNINTQVTVNNGQTVVLGGVYEIANRNDVSKIPFFGELPVVGNLFKHTNKSEQKGELMIFITPYMIEEQDLDSGMEEVAPEIDLKKK